MGTAVTATTIGLLFIAIGRYTVRRERGFRRHAVRVPGVVVGHETTDIHGHAPHPILQFRTLDGTDKTVRSDVGTDLPHVRKGEAVVVMYDPRDPEIARPEQLHSTAALLPWLLFLGGMALVLGGIATGVIAAG
jgi:hypothetical protein